MGELTKAHIGLLQIAGREHRQEDGWQPRFDHAHSKHIPRLLQLRAMGLLSFTHADPLICITDAGRNALSKEANPHG